MSEHRRWPVMLKACLKFVSEKRIDECDLCFIFYYQTKEKYFFGRFSNRYDERTPIKLMNKFSSLLPLFLSLSLFLENSIFVRILKQVIGCDESLFCLSSPIDWHSSLPLSCSFIELSYSSFLSFAFYPPLIECHKREAFSIPNARDSILELIILRPVHLWKLLSFEPIALSSNWNNTHSPNTSQWVCSE